MPNTTGRSSRTTLSYGVSERTVRIPAADYLAGFVDVPRCESYCRECSLFGQNWSCPPFDFDPSQVWASRTWFEVTARTMTFLPGQPRDGLESEDLKDAVRRLFSTEKRRAHRSLMAWCAARPGSIPVGAGGCELCADCTRRRGAPCRLPNQLVHSIESLGGDVSATLARLFDQPIAWSDGESLPDRFVLVYGLLTDAAEPAPAAGSAAP